MNANDISCQNRREAITALVLGELEASAVDDLKEHIVTCPGCKVLYEDLAEEEETIRSAFQIIDDRNRTVSDNLIAQLEKSSDESLSKPVVQRHIWSRPRSIRILARIAAAAIIVVAVSIFSLLNHRQESSDGVQFSNGLSFLSRACAAEQILFSGSGVAHIVNEIVVYPVPKEKPASEILDKLNLTPEQREYLETVNSWMDYDWLPLCSLQASGEFRYNQLELSKDIDQSYIITDEAWYEQSTGCFSRVMKMEGQVIFANSYDGEFVYFSERGADGFLRLLSERVRAGFKAPQNPGEFLGITAGLQNSIDSQTPVLGVTEGMLEDGTVVSIYKLGFVDLLGQADTYWLFNVREDNNIVAEMEFVLAGSSQILIRRVLSESVESPAISWDMAAIDLELQQQTDEISKVAVSTDVIRANVSIQYIIDKAGFETSIFGVRPPWTAEAEIGDIADFANPDKRMFVFTYRADDGRHIIVCQSETFNDFLASILSWAQDEPIYTSSNGFKLWGGGPDKWWTELHLRSCGFIPADDRSGYVIESPAGTYLSLAINGQLTDDELYSLVDSLVSAKEYQKLMKGKSDE